MGLDYSYEIFMPPRNVVRALTWLAELAPQGRDTPPLPITLPGGEQLIVPFTSQYKSDRSAVQQAARSNWTPQS